MNQLKRRRQRESGQGLLEYALAVMMMIMVFNIMNNGIKKGIGGMWRYMAQNIAAGCPVPEPGQGCQESIPPEIK